MSLNRVILIGRLTKSPELRYTPNGVANCRFTLAVNRQFKKEGQPEADFINCTAWQKQAENLANFIQKGGLVAVEGRIQTGSYDGQDGKKIFTTDIVAENIQYLEPKSSGQQQGNYQQPAPQSNSTGNYGGGQPSYDNQSQQQYGGTPNYQQNQPPQNQQNYSRMDEDPFANSKGPIQIDEDSLPFNYHPLG